MRLVVIMNEQANSARQVTPRDIALAFEAAGAADVRILRTPPDGLAEAARDAAPSCDIVVAAGGDGTASAVAAGLLGLDTPMAVLPLGTWNHFAKDVAMPMDLNEAAQAIVHGSERAVDVGEVNGRLFLNNSSIGLYPDVVHTRERLRAKHGWKKWFAMLVAAASVLTRLHRLIVLVDLKDKLLPRRTPFVFIGNNRYSPDIASQGLRQSLSRGELSIYTTRTTSRLRLALLAVRALVRPLEGARDVDVEARPELVVQAPVPRLRVARDGEVEWLETPLRYRSLPAALRVRVPREGA